MTTNTVILSMTQIPTDGHGVSTIINPETEKRLIAWTKLSHKEGKLSLYILYIFGTLLHLGVARVLRPFEEAFLPSTRLPAETQVA